MVRRKTSFFWPDAGFASMAMQGAMLAIEANQVIALRLAKMALGGPSALREAELMVSEKLETMAEGGRLMAMAALTGEHDLGAGPVVQLYRRKVRRNRRRLTGL